MINLTKGQTEINRRPIKIACLEKEILVSIVYPNVQREGYKMDYFKSTFHILDTIF
jgi:hypothetical protein